MTTSTEFTPIDVVAIEREARALRARALGEMAGQVRAWLRARLTGRPAMTATAAR